MVRMGNGLFRITVTVLTDIHPSYNGSGALLMRPFQTHLTLDPSLPRPAICESFSTNQAWPNVIIRIVRTVMSPFGALPLSFGTGSLPLWPLSTTLFLRSVASGGSWLGFAMFLGYFSNRGSRLGCRLSGVWLPGSIVSFSLKWIFKWWTCE